MKAQHPEATAIDSAKLNIADANEVDAFNWQDYSVIINAAAYTRVDEAETDTGRIEAWSVNATGVANLARVAIKHQLLLIHFSSDYVFDGREKSLTEATPFSPLGIYGQSKAAGDLSASLVNKHYILRTSWVIGDGNNFVRTMLGLAQKGINPTVVADQIGRPTFTNELVNAVDYLLDHDLPFGTYNLSNEGKAVSWADLARTTFRLSGLNDAIVTDTTTEMYYAGKSNIAPRPRNSMLDLTKIEAAGYMPMDWEENLIQYLEKEQLL